MKSQSKMGRQAIGLITALALGVGLSSCVGSASPNRSASAEWPEQVTCPEHSSWSAPVIVDNNTAVPIKLTAGEIDCYDWSGVSTPPTVFNDQVVGAHSSRTFTLEARDNINRYWSMRFHSDGNNPAALGGARVRLAKTSGRVIPHSANGEEISVMCMRYPLGSDPSSTASKPVSELDRVSRIMFWSDGTTIFLVHCVSSVEDWSGF